MPATIDFETVGNTWTWTQFAGGTFSVVPNPETGGINTSATCAKLTVASGSARWAGVYTYSFPSTTLDATNCIIKVMVKKDVVSNFHLELNGPNEEGADVDFVEVTNTSTTGWEELTFDFSAFIGHTYTFMKVIPDFSAVNPRNYASTSYWDNIYFGPQAPAPTTNIIDFETVGNTWTWTQFAGGNFSVVANPLNAGINTSAHCAKLVVNADAARWAGVYTSNFPSKTLDATNCIIKVMVYKDVVSNFHLELNGPHGGEDEDLIVVSNTLTTGWEELTFDFSAYIGRTYNFMKIIPDFAGSARNYASTSYWDHISFGPQPPAPSISLIDFETIGNTWTWTMFSNGTSQPTDFSVATNPLNTGINTSLHSAKLVVNADAARWAGVYTSNFPSKTLDATNCIIKVMVYKNVLSKFHLELNGPNGEGADEDLVAVTNTSTTGWEELTFDFTSFIGNTYSFLKIIPDFAASARTYGSINYWDNIAFSPNTSTGISSNQIQNPEIFPNPLNNVLNIKTNVDIANITINNLSGQNIKKFVSTRVEQSFDISDLSAGTYIVTLVMKDGNRFTQKVVKL